MMPSTIAVIGPAGAPGAVHGGAHGCSSGAVPGETAFQPDDVRAELTPLGYSAVCGMIYRAGDAIEQALEVTGIGGFSGLIGALRSVFTNLASKLMRLGPGAFRPAPPDDTSRKADSGVRPVTPSSIAALCGKPIPAVLTGPAGDRLPRSHRQAPAASGWRQTEGVRV
jgi:hypothetical protein